MKPEEIKAEFEAKKAALEAEEAEAIKRAEEKELKEKERLALIDKNATEHATRLTKIFDKVELELIAMGVRSIDIQRKESRTPFGIEKPASFITHVKGIQVEYRYRVEYKGVPSTYHRDVGTHDRVMWIIIFEKRKPRYSGRGSSVCRFKQSENGRVNTRKLAERMLEYADFMIDDGARRKAAKEKEVEEQKFRKEIREKYNVKKYTSEFLSFDSDKRINMKLRFLEENHPDFHELMAYIMEFYPHLVADYLEKEGD